MEYNKYIGKEVYIDYKTAKYLNYSLWKERGFPTKSISGKIINGTFGVAVVKSDDEEITLRLDDNLIVFCEIMTDDNEFNI